MRSGVARLDRRPAADWAPRHARGREAAGMFGTIGTDGTRGTAPCAFAVLPPGNVRFCDWGARGIAPAIHRRRLTTERAETRPWGGAQVVDTSSFLCPTPGACGVELRLRLRLTPNAFGVDTKRGEVSTPKGVFQGRFPAAAETARNFPRKFPRTNIQVVV